MSYLIDILHMIHFNTKYKITNLKHFSTVPQIHTPSPNAYQYQQEPHPHLELKPI
jgi:hypothetical protein